MSRSPLFKLVRNLALGLVALVLIIVAVVYGNTYYRMHRTHTVAVQQVAIPTSEEALARGQHLVKTRGCADCHGKDLGGNLVINDPMAGELHGSNLTRGSGGLPADYTDADYVGAIRHGIAKDGRALLLMPSIEYAELSDEDLGAAIAYLKTVPNVDRERGPVAPGPIIRLLMTLGQFKIAAEEINHTAVRPKSVAADINLEFGKYVAATCTGCHGENFSGGKIPGAPPHWPEAANLTVHPSAGASTWNETQFLHALRAGERPDRTKLNPIMPAAFGQMTDVELKALWMYIRSLPPFEKGAR
jgi:cytochrome c553